MKGGRWRRRRRRGGTEITMGSVVRVVEGGEEGVLYEGLGSIGCGKGAMGWKEQGDERGEASTELKGEVVGEEEVSCFSKMAGVGSGGGAEDLMGVPGGTMGVIGRDIHN